MYRGLGDRVGEASALTGLGAVQHAHRQPPQPPPPASPAPSVCTKSLADQACEASALTELGALQHATGNTTAAAAQPHPRPRPLHRGGQPGRPGQCPDPARRRARRRRGRRQSSRRPSHKALDMYRYLGDRLGEARALTSLGTIQHATGNHRSRRGQPHPRPGAVPRGRRPARRGRSPEQGRRDIVATTATRRPATSTPRRWPSRRDLGTPPDEHAPSKASAGATSRTATRPRPARACARPWRSTSASDRPAARRVQHTLRDQHARQDSLTLAPER